MNLGRWEAGRITRGTKQQNIITDHGRNISGQKSRSDAGGQKQLLVMISGCMMTDKQPEFNYGCLVVICECSMPGSVADKQPRRNNQWTTSLSSGAN